KYSLKQDRYIIEVEFHGENILKRIEEEEYDLILLDILLPNVNGLKLCESIRRRSEIPMIIITKKNEDMSKILALEYGADDYLVKPFNILELKARIKALLRRANYENNNGEIVEVGDFKINPLGRKINIKD